MAVVGTAEVVIRALTQKLREDIKRGLEGAAADAEKQGAVAGDAWIKGFKDRIQQSLSGDGGIDFDGIIKRSQDAGSQAGEAHSEGFEKGARRRRPNIPSPNFSNAGPNIPSIPSGGGGGGAAALNDTGEAASNAGMSLSRMTVKILILLPIIATLIAALSALVSGLFAIAAAAAVAAAGALALLPGIIGGLVAAIGVAVIAFKGIGKAVTELGEKQAKGAKLAMQHARAERAAARAVANAAKAITAAHERVSDAQERVSDAVRSLERARRDAARGAVDAARRVVDAEERIVDAQERAQRAQEALNDARRDAKERLEDLQLSLRGAVLGEEEATLRLRRAREEYAKTTRDPGATRDEREQARIDLQQAELALDQAKDRRDDLTEQTIEANKAGVEGSDQVVAAKEEIEDANKAVLDSEQALQRAREDQAQQAVDAAERISDAQESLSDAYRGVRDAQQGVIDAQQRYADAVQAQQETLAANREAVAALTEEYNKLSPAGKRVAELLNSLRDEMTKIKHAVQEALLPAFEELLKLFTADFWMGTWKTGLTDIATAIGDVIRKFTELFSDPTAHEDFHAFFRIAAQLTRDLGGAFVTILRALLDLTAGGEEFFGRFGKYIGDLAQRFADFIDNARNSGALEDFFTLAFDAARAVGDALGAMFGIIKDLSMVAAPFGIMLLDMFTGATNAKREFFKTDEGQAGLKQFFSDIMPNFIAVIKLLGEIGAAFIRVGTTPAVKQIMDQLRTEFMPELEKLIVALTEKVAPALFRVITAAVKFFRTLSESVILQSFVNLLADIAEAVAFLFDIPLVNEFAVAIGVFIAVVMGSVKLIGIFQGLAGGLSLIRGALMLVRAAVIANPLGAIVFVLSAIVVGLVIAYKKFETFRNIVDAVAKAIVGAFDWVLDKLLRRSSIPDIVNGIIEWFTKAKDFLFAVVGAIRDFVVGYFNGIKDSILIIVQAIRIVIGTYVNLWKTTITTIVTAIFIVVSAIFNRIKDSITVTLTAIRIVIETIVGQIRDKISVILTAVRIIFETIVGKIKAIWDAFWIALRTVTENILGGIKTRIGEILGSIRSGFESAVGFIADAWDGIREAINKPIRTVIDIAYNKGIVKFWNKLAGVVGAPELKEIKFARGGYVPGYAPGQDRVRALLSPGEGVLVPEAVRGLARQMGTTPAKAINMLNAQWTSRVPGSGGRFAGGGYISGSTRNAWGGPRDWVKSKWDDATDWFAGQLAKGAEALLKPIYTLVDNVVPKNRFGTEILAQVPRVVGGKILGFLRRKDDEDEEGGGVGGGKIGSGQIGSSYRSLVRLFKDSDLPGVVTSTIRRARFPGDQSNHIRGRAADFSGNHGNRGYRAKVLRDIFHLFADNVGKDLAELILAGAPFNIKRGKKVPGYAWGKPGSPGNHWNHVHVAAMAEGGTVLPRAGGTLALLAEAGRPESVVDTGLLNERLKDLAGARDGSREIVRELRRQNIILERLASLDRINIEKLVTESAPGERAEQSLPRTLRQLTYTLGS